MSETTDRLLTLEPLITVVRDALSGAGWKLSGLEKTTSHEFVGRWEGGGSRRAYLFFHCDRVADFVRIDSFLEESPRGLRGDLALVFAAPELADLTPMPQFLAALSRMTVDCMPEGYKIILSVKLRLEGPREDPRDAETEVRLRLPIPAGAIDAGGYAVSSLVSLAVAGFERMTGHETFAMLGDPRG